MQAWTARNGGPLNCAQTLKKAVQGPRAQMRVEGVYSYLKVCKQASGEHEHTYGNAGIPAGWPDCVQSSGRITTDKLQLAFTACYNASLVDVASLSSHNCAHAVV